MIGSITCVMPDQLVSVKVTERLWFGDWPNGPPVRTVRLRLRLPFAKWSAAVERDGLASVRAWLEQAEEILNQPARLSDL